MRNPIPWTLGDLGTFVHIVRGWRSRDSTKHCTERIRDQQRLYWKQKSMGHCVRSDGVTELNKCLSTQLYLEITLLLCETKIERMLDVPLRRQNYAKVIAFSAILIDSCMNVPYGAAAQSNSLANWMKRCSSHRWREYTYGGVDGWTIRKWNIWTRLGNFLRERCCLRADLAHVQKDQLHHESWSLSTSE